ncbi:class I SAM-dependent methyltransferase [Kribbella sp. NPDC058245]|uniref:class I SAM-dependent methyltransferase n=1 Tax=Kribbella sp. NPDC058245 TaxID=3346399 RepID=UPI0036ED2377
MVDDLFADPRLAPVYDALEPAERDDLEPYAAMVTEFGAERILDVGCGTGELACLLAGRGVEVIGVDPAAASLEVAKGKEFADRVQWVHGDATTLPPLQVDLAVMTGNVAQVFLTDEEWSATVAGIRAALKPGGRFVFETRDPAYRAWEQWAEWTRESTYREVQLPSGETVANWGELTQVDLPYVSFRGTYVFSSDGVELTSESTLWFRERDEVSLDGFVVDEVRDAPDRPGREFVFVTRSADNV